MLAIADAIVFCPPVPLLLRVQRLILQTTLLPREFAAAVHKLQESDTTQAPLSKTISRVISPIGAITLQG